jgi:hypothetical protein
MRGENKARRGIPELLLSEKPQNLLPTYLRMCQHNISAQIQPKVIFWSETEQNYRGLLEALAGFHIGSWSVGCALNLKTKWWWLHEPISASPEKAARRCPALGVGNTFLI